VYASINYKALTHTSLTILLHVMYSVSSHGVSNCYTHSCIININYLAGFYDGATVIRGWKQVTELPMMLQGYLDEKWASGQASWVGSVLTLSLPCCALAGISSNCIYCCLLLLASSSLTSTPSFFHWNHTPRHKLSSLNQQKGVITVNQSHNGIHL